MWSVAEHEHYTTEALKRKRQVKQSGNVKSLIWAQKGKLYIIYETMM
jgi:hypothetical protein